MELTFVYLLEGCGKTQSEINDTIPHTVVDMEYQGTECTYPMYLHEVSVVPFGPFNKKTSTFSIEDLRKTLSQYVMSHGNAERHQQSYEILSNGQHSQGYYTDIITIITAVSP